MTTMYDSTNPFDIPTTAGMVAGYIDGIYAWPADGWLRFAGKPAWKIAIFYGTDNGNVLDVENGDATPAQAPVWVKKRLASGLQTPAILYVNRSNRGAVEQALAAAGVTAQQAALWVATLDGTQAVPAGPYPVVAVQYANSTLAGGHYDLSVVNQFGGGAGQVTGDEMTPQLANILVRYAYFFIRDGEPSQAELDGWLGAIGTDENKALADLVAIIDSPESIAYRAKVAKVIAAAGTPPTPDDDTPYVLQSAYGKHTHRNDGADPASAPTGTPV